MEAYLWADYKTDASELMCNKAFLFPPGNFKVEIPKHSLLQLSSIQLSLIPSSN